MLVSTSTKLDKNDIVSFKLVNGDEVVAKYVDYNEVTKEYTMSRPLTVMPSQQGVGFFQTVITGIKEKDVVVSKDHIMMIVPSEKDVCDHYLALTTGIQPVTNGKIIT